MVDQDLFARVRQPVLRLCHGRNRSATGAADPVCRCRAVATRLAPGRNARSAVDLLESTLGWRARAADRANRSATSSYPDLPGRQPVVQPASIIVGCAENVESPGRGDPVYD